MRVLLLGGGGREHVLGWKLAQGNGVTEVAAAPGNPGLAAIGPCLDVPVTEPDAVVAAAAGYDLVVVGPEAPLAAGVADALAAAGIAVFGPTRAAARLESSKAFAKQVMQAAHIPTGGAAVFRDEAAALAHLTAAPGPYVVKADGLAAGKGVLVTDDPAEAASWVRHCLGGGFGAAGARVLIEEHLDGQEVSVLAICAGTAAVPLTPARDHKRLGDGDEGPNTGGMGAYSPVPDLPAGLVERTVAEVIVPALEHLAASGTPYLGFLYAGLMLTDDGPRVLEFNCRLGDPETQVILPRLDADLAEVLAAAAADEVPQSLAWTAEAAVDVVLAAAGYPERPRTGDVIKGIAEAAAVPGALLFHAGTRLRGDDLVTAGGRVLNVVGTGAGLGEARQAAYEAAGKIEFPGRQFRTDIAGPASDE